MTGRGRLHLLPVPLGDAQGLHETLPERTLASFRRIDHFIVESAKTARAMLRPLIGDRPVQALSIREIGTAADAQAVRALLDPALAGHDMGVVSDTGCPAVADPGAVVVAAAHEAGIEVVPHVGPNSLLLALMASGLGGQRFASVGYVPANTHARDASLRSLEARSRRDDETLLFIETPYRNQALFDAMLAVLAPSTRVLVAIGLTRDEQRIDCRTVHGWRTAAASARELPVRIPAVFGLKAAATGSAKPCAEVGARKRGRKTGP